MNNDLINRWAYLFQKLSMGSSPISFEQGTKFITKSSSVNLKSLIVPEPVLGAGRERYFAELNQRKTLAISKFERFLDLHAPQSSPQSTPISLNSPTSSPNSSPIKQTEESDVEITTPIESPIITPVDTPTSSAPQSPETSRNNSAQKTSPTTLPPLPVDPFGPLLPTINDGTKDSPRSPRSAKKLSNFRPLMSNQPEEVHLSDVSLQFGDA